MSIYSVLELSLQPEHGHFPQNSTYSFKLFYLSTFNDYFLEKIDGSAQI